MASFPDLPKFDESKRYLLRGDTANLLRESIERRTPIPGEGLLGTYTKAGIVLRVSGESGSSSSSSSSSRIPPSTSGSSSSSGSSVSTSGSESNSSGSSAPPSGSKTAIVPFRDTHIAWYAEERKDSIFGDCIDIEVGTKYQVAFEHVESVAPGTLKVVSNETVDRPGIGHAELFEEDGEVFLKARSWGLYWFSRRPKIVRVMLEGIVAGMEDAGWMECSAEVATKNKKWWSQAHQIPQDNAEDPEKIPS